MKKKERLTKEARQRLEKRWSQHIVDVSNDTKGVDRHEPPAAKAARIRRAREDFGFFVQHYFPHYAEKPSPAFHLEAAERVKSDPNIKAVIEWFRGAAKSVLFDCIIPIWLANQEQRGLNLGVIIGANLEAATRLLIDLQVELTANERLLHDFGDQKTTGSWEKGEFTTAAGVKFIALGMRQGVRGLRNRQHRPDYIVIDDIDDLDMSRNPARLSQAVSWIERSILGMLDEGDSRVFIVNNRIAKDQVMTRMQKAKPHWWHSFVPAHDGIESAWPDKFSMDFWRRKERDMGAASFSTECLLVPVTEGRQFKEEWIKWAVTPPLERVVGYIDPSWRDGPKSDHKAAKVWGRSGDIERHLLRAFVRRCSIDELANWCYDQHQRLLSADPPMAVEWWIEGIFMQDDHLQEFERIGRERGWMLPIIPDMRAKPAKVARIQNMIPIYKRGLITYDESQRDDPDMVTAVEHLLAWDVTEAGVPDDSPDADESALHIINQGHGLSGDGWASFGPGPTTSDYDF